MDEIIELYEEESFVGLGTLFDGNVGLSRKPRKKDLKKLRMIKRMKKKLCF